VAATPESNSWRFEGTSKAVFAGLAGLGAARRYMRGPKMASERKGATSEG
jgi:hypothetical protein